MAVEESAEIKEHEDSPATSSGDAAKVVYLSGWRLHTLTIAICVCIFVVNIEVVIVSTSLTRISDSLGESDHVNWIVTAYLVTYTSFLIVWAKFSDIFGRKWPLLEAFVLFVLFSAGCGASQTMTQLIICRAFQGFAGSGSFSLSTVIFFQMVPKAQIPLYGTLVFTVVALASASGPLIGGAIVEGSTWRWIFLLNVPVGAFAIGLILMAMPSTFPRNQPSSGTRAKISRESISPLFNRVDLAGTLFLLAASLLLITALLEAPTSLAWSSSPIICLLVFSALSWVSFGVYERHLTRKCSEREPTFPWRFWSNRPWIAMLLMAFLVGMPMTVITVDLPQIFQTTQQLSPLQAGIRLLPFCVGVPFGSFTGNLIAALTRARPIFILLAGAMLQVIGLALLTTVPIAGTVPASINGFLVIIALGAGLTFSILVTTTPHAVEERDLAVAAGSIVQLRMMGSTIGLAIATTVLNNTLAARLVAVLSEAQLEQVLHNLGTIPELSQAAQASVEAAFGGAFAIHVKILLGVVVAQVLAVPLMWRRPQLAFH